MSDKSFAISHAFMKSAYPKKTQITPDVWLDLVTRADDLNALAQSSKGLPGFSETREGQFLSEWMKTTDGQRLFTDEQKLVPLFAELTQPLNEVNPDRTEFAPPPALAGAISGTSNGIDLAALAKRFAGTSLENRDGETQKIPLKALAESLPVMKKSEWPAIQEIYRQYFGYTRTVTLFEDANVKVQLTERLEPTSIEVNTEGRKPEFNYLRVPQKLTVAAPDGSRVAIRPVAKDYESPFVYGKDIQGTEAAEHSIPSSIADIGKANGNYYRSDSYMPTKVEVLVTRDSDGITDVCAPRALARLEVPLPNGKFTHLE